MQCTVPSLGKGFGMQITPLLVDGMAYGVFSSCLQNPVGGI